MDYAFALLEVCKHRHESDLGLWGTDFLLASQVALVALLRSVGPILACLSLPSIIV